MTRLAARNGAENQLAAAVIDAIAEQPAMTGEIVEAAIRAMPHLQEGVVDKILAAFPGFRDIVLAAATRAQAPLSAQTDAAPATVSAETTQAVRAPPRQEDATARRRIMRLARGQRKLAIPWRASTARFSL